VLRKTCLRRSMAIAVFALTSGANADWYSCKDPRYGGDSPPAECRGEICVTKQNGARTCTRPPETPDQRKEREEQEKRQRGCEKKARDIILDDSRFSRKYETEEDIEKERDRFIAEHQRLIDDAKRHLDDGKAKRAKLAEEAKFYEHHPMPDNLERDIENNRQMLELQEHAATSALNEMRQMNEKYDAMRKRREDLIQNRSRTERCD
jgi:hypothetical protein